MNVLILCECSDVVRSAFERKGHFALSVDLLPNKNSKAIHIQDDVFKFFEYNTTKWDLIIAHPDCTALCVAGNHVYAAGKPKHNMRKRQVLWINKLWQLCQKRAKKVCFENPVGVLSTMGNLPKPQYIQPYEFGEDASKKTGLFLHGLDRLKPTKRIVGRFVNGVERWSNQTDSGQNKLGPSKDRWYLRAKTYQGIANAMAEQWGGINQCQKQ